VAGDLDDATVEELIDLYRAAQGQHPTGPTMGPPWFVITAWLSASGSIASTASPDANGQLCLAEVRPGSVARPLRIAARQDVRGPGVLCVGMCRSAATPRSAAALVDPALPRLSDRRAGPNRTGQDPAGQ
jgi:hypothetical protein